MCLEVFGVQAEGDRSLCRCLEVVLKVMEVVLTVFEDCAERCLEIVLKVADVVPKVSLKVVGDELRERCLWARIDQLELV